MLKSRCLLSKQRLSDMQRNKKNQLRMGTEINQPNLTQNSQSFSRGHYNYISNVQKVRQTRRRYVEVQQYFYRWAMHPLRSHRRRKISVLSSFMSPDTR